MPFDANLVLLDGTTTITAGNDDAPTTETRTNGAIVLDIKETGRFGLVAVLVCPAALTSGDATSSFTGHIESCDTLAFTSTAGIERHGSFGVANTGTGVILGAECPCVAFIRFATKKRYVRANFTVVIAGVAFGAPQILLSPYPFEAL